MNKGAKVKKIRGGPWDLVHGPGPWGGSWWSMDPGPCFIYVRLILKENSFQFSGKHYFQTHGTAMGTKMAVAFANIFMASIEKEILRQSVYKPLTWKRFIDDVFCLWDTNKEEIEHFNEQANLYHPTI